MKVRAIQLGFFGGKRRREGEVFDVPEKVSVVVEGEREERPFQLGKWMEPVEADEPADEGSPHAGPEGQPVTVSLKGKVGAARVAKPAIKVEPKADA